jgi:hypothetical protein
MRLSDALFLEPAALNMWIAARTDGLAGSGTAHDPFNGATRQEAKLEIGLSYLNESPQEARINTAPIAHGFVNGDVVKILGVTGPFAAIWNGTFGIYEVSEFGFRYFMKKSLPPDQPVEGNPTGARLTFPFDEVMREIPPNTRIHLGPGVFQTRGFGTDAVGTTDERGFQVKSGWKIVGSGMDVTTLQLVGADIADYHYHALGMPIEPEQGSTTPITPLEHFDFINTPLQRGVWNRPKCCNRFNGLPVARKTVKTVGTTRHQRPNTLLKQGVNENFSASDFHPRDRRVLRAAVADGVVKTRLLIQPKILLKCVRMNPHCL